MRKGVVDTSQYADDPKELLLGQVAILGGNQLENTSKSNSQ